MKDWNKESINWAFAGFSSFGNWLLLGFYWILHHVGFGSFLRGKWLGFWGIILGLLLLILRYFLLNAGLLKFVLVLILVVVMELYLVNLLLWDMFLTFSLIDNYLFRELDCSLLLVMALNFTLYLLLIMLLLGRLFLVMLINVLRSLLWLL